MARIPRSGGQTASGGGAGGVGMGLLNAIIADMLGKVVGSVVAPGGGVVAPPIPSAQGSKYNQTAPDVIAIQRQVDDENYRRAALNEVAKLSRRPQMPYLNAQQIIQDIVNTNRQLMDEAGARERAIAAIGAQGEVQKAIGGGLANAIGTGLTGTSQVISQGIATGGQRFDNQRQLEELSRAV
jgi:hypothetical protein